MGTTQLIIIVIIITVVLYFLFGNNKKGILRKNKKLEDLSTSDRLEILDFGPYKDCFTVVIKSKNRHEEDDDQLFWYEFEGTTSRNEDFWLQLESIDPYDVNGGTTKVSIYELGTTIENLLSVNNQELAFRYKSDDFFLDTEGKAKFFVNNSESGEDYTYREFINGSGDTFISLEISNNEEAKVYLSFALDISQIVILDDDT